MKAIAWTCDHCGPDCLTVVERAEQIIRVVDLPF